MSRKAVTPYDYRLAPDGEDVLRKLQFVWKPAIFASFSLGTCDVMLNSKPKTYLATFGRYAYMSIPAMGASTAFVLGSNIAGSLRKKNDKYNWAFGGSLSGAMIGVWRQHPQLGVGCAALFAFAAGMVRHYQLLGVDIVSPVNVPRMYGGARISQYDYTIMAERD